MDERRSIWDQDAVRRHGRSRSGRSRERGRPGAAKRLILTNYRQLPGTLWSSYAGVGSGSGSGTSWASPAPSSLARRSSSRRAAPNSVRRGGSPSVIRPPWTSP